MKMNPFVHFEMPVKNRDRMRKFYETAFGRQTEQPGEEMGGYVLVTIPYEKTGLPERAGIINCGFYRRNDELLSRYLSVSIAVGDIKKAMKSEE